ncbi:hypothetical protein [Mycoplasma parvum]|uniref:Uncharacterized protein n=1 Tax=Mycoplasma parvum str. Indiana TaxID=1403316 RepID=U5NCG9_9MOLU|nr:hypothetical protein [Mycoplasma parvum]AGX89020.1 hypothetical protein PRV_01295 [Mycoplasma parvum str. Indiana]
MFCYKFFSPEEVIKNYLSEFSGNTQNKTHSSSIEYLQKVETLRKSASSSLNLLDSHFLTFQHNQYYIENLIFNFLKLDKNWIVFTNEPTNSEFEKVNKIYNLDELQKKDKFKFEGKKILVWISKLSFFDKHLFRIIRELKKESLSPFYSYLSLNNFFYDFFENKEILKEISFISFDPSVLFQEYGTHFFWFRKENLISPIFLGSNAVKKIGYNNQFFIKEFPHSLEIGTSNLISLIMLERFFYFLNKEGSKVLSNIFSKKLNFNFLSNFKENNEH